MRFKAGEIGSEIRILHEKPHNPVVKLGGLPFVKGKKKVRTQTPILSTNSIFLFVTKREPEIQKNLGRFRIF